jgi:hypothetical protein
MPPYYRTREFSGFSGVPDRSHLPSAAVQVLNKAIDRGFAIRVDGLDTTD